MRPQNPDARSRLEHLAGFEIANCRLAQRWFFAVAMVRALTISRRSPGTREGEWRCSS